MVSDMKELGQKIREARNSKNITYETLYEKTRISMETIRAIENGEVRYLPSPHFRAFVRTLAKEIGLEPEALLREFDSRQKRFAEEQKLLHSSDSIILRFQSFVDGKRKQIIIFGFMIVIFILIGLYAKYGIKLFYDPGPATFTFNTSDSSDTDGFTLQVVSLKGCWIDVQVDSGVPENRFIERSQQLTWSGKKTIYLGISDGECARLLLNGIELEWEQKNSRNGVELWVNEKGIERIERRVPNIAIPKEMQSKPAMHTVLMGYIKIEDLLQQFSQYASKRDGYSPDQEMIHKITDLHADVSIICFFGTWDTLSAEIVPKLLRIQQMSVLSQDSLKLFAVGREMKDDSGLVKHHRIQGIPTIVFFYQGHELGRIVGSPNKHLESLILEIVEKSKYFGAPNEETDTDTIYQDVGNRE
jgi:transcriptional regulator with XRE-family HTH domain